MWNRNVTPVFSGGKGSIGSQYRLQKRYIGGGFWRRVLRMGKSYAPVISEVSLLVATVNGSQSRKRY